MFRQMGIGAAAVLAAGVLAVGCSDDSGDTIISGGSLTTDNFPGSQVAENNVADDGRAFSNQAQNVQGKDLFRVYRNVSNGTAIVLYETETTNNGNRVLYAVYFDGTRFQAPVQLRFRDLSANPQVFGDAFDGVGGFKVLWLNTAGRSSAEARARDGDAIILATLQDEDAAPGVTTGEDPNTRLWATYFDRSAATAAAANGVQGGFTVDARTIDEELTLNVVAGDDPSVGAFGFVSDSLHGTHEFTDETDSVDSGDDTHGAIIVYAKQESSTTGVRYHQRPVNLDAADNDLDTLFAAETTISNATSIAAGDNVDGDGFIVNDEFMLYQTSVTDNAATDNPVTVVQFDEDGEVDVAELGTPVSATNDTADRHDVDAANVFGRDHKLAALYVVFTETGFDADGGAQATGDRDDDTDVMVAQINYDDASLTVQNVKVDPFADTIDTTAGATNRVGTNTGADLLGTRINRTSDFITILMGEVNSDVTDVATITDINELGYMAAVHTRAASTLGATATRDLDVSVTDETTGGHAQPVRIPSLVGSGIATTTPDVTDLEFQTGYAGGLAFSQAWTGTFIGSVLPEPGCAIQADAFQHNVIFEQARGGASDLEDLFWNGIEVTVTNGTAQTPDVTTVPELDLVVTGSASELVATRDTDYNNDFDAVAVDAGDLSRETTGEPTLESGRPLVFFVVDRNNPTNDVAGSNVEDLGLSAYEDGDTELLSTPGPRQDWDQFAAMLDVITVGVNESTTHDAGTRHHVIWTEAVDNDFGNGDVSGARIVTRSYEIARLNDSDTTNDTLLDRFVPPTDEDPVQLDNPTDGDLLETVSGTTQGAQVFSTARNGTTAALYFTEDEHIYYTDTTTDATGWDSANGVAAPQLVDNDDTLGQRVIGWFNDVNADCDNLARSMVFFVREDANQNGSGASNGSARRVNVRIHQ